MDNRSPYLTAEQLGIEQWERDGLIALIDPLSRGKLNLNMNYAVHPATECGTTHCIGGWLGFFQKMSRTEIVNYVRASNLSCLYYPWRSYEEYTFYQPNTKQAAQAVINFLMTKDPQWSVVMASD